MTKYEHLQIEPKWQKYWAENQTFRAHDNSEKPKFYALDMFPYPSGAGLHVGHPVGYTATDIISRKKRHQGYNVLHPMGWDAFGLPAENYAIKTGVNPRKSTYENIDTFRRQLQALGFSYDWKREFATTDEDYFKWTQWLFLQMYKKGLLYEKKMPMNWCPKCHIVAANEEVESGKHERCGADVERRNLRQWMFKITDYADRLIADLDAPNVVMIHGWGGDSSGFSEDQKYLEQNNIQVFSPDMPNTDNPIYEEWKAYFEKNILPHLKENTILVGHSLGCGFIQKYLSENDLKVGEIVFLAPTVSDCGIPEIKNFFTKEFDYKKIKKSADNIYVFGGGQDEYITEKEFRFLAEKLEAHFDFDPNKDHCSFYNDTKQFFEKVVAGILNWPEKVKAMQRNWIGRSEGAEVDFELEDKSEKITVFTTRPDTLFGATYFVMSPEHPLVDKIATIENKEKIAEYKTKCAAKSELERTELNKEKSGVFTGAYVINPVNGEKMPVWIADYVLMTYGTGAIMAVPAHDERDHEFAEKYDLKIVEVVDGLEDPFQKTGGVLKNSEFLNGLSIEESIKQSIKFLEEKEQGKRKVQYKLRDWIFTRQRYWGEPIPLVHCEKCGIVPIDESELPLRLPETDSFLPTADGQSPLAKIEDWVNTKCPQCNGEAKRETSTMPNWAGSNWYWLRYMDNKNDQEFCSKENENYWGPVDLYVGGAEHAVLHLLYSRFWHKVFYDMGFVTTKEPFKKLVNTGLILAEDGVKMSKSLGNVINPDEMVEKFGADSLRVYEMFMGPFEQPKAWSEKTLAGTRKFLDRVWRLFQKPIVENFDNESSAQVLHKTIKIVGEHIDDFKFNTAISQLMVLTNELTGAEKVSKQTLETFSILLSPFAPHLAEEFWQMLGHEKSIAFESWPEYDESLLVEDSVTYAVQVNGKVRADFEISKDAEKEEVLTVAKGLEKVQKYLTEGDIKKEIFVPGKIVGFVVK